MGSIYVTLAPPRQSTALRQQFATANSTTDSGLFLFPKNLLTSKICLGALIIFGVLGAYFTRRTPPNQNNPNHFLIAREWFGFILYINELN